MKKLSSKTVVQNKEYYQYMVDFYTSTDVQEYFNDFKKFVGPLPNKSNVLDLGCGIGHFSHYLIEKGHEVISLDINHYALNYGKKRGWIKTPIQASVEKIPLKNNSIDLVFFLDVIEHVKNPSACLGEIRRIFKKEGNLYLITPNAIYDRLFGHRGEIDPTHVHEFDWFELKRFLHRNGFRIIKARASGVPLINRLSHRLSRNVARVMGGPALPIASPSFWVKAKVEK